MGSKWVHAKLGDYIHSNLGKMLDQNKNKGDFQPYLGNSNVRWGYFDLEDLSLMKFEEHESDRYGIRKGDLIICEGGEPGRCAIWEDDVPNMKIQKALHRVRPLPGLTSEYLYYWFLYYGRTGQLDAYFTGTTIKHLTGKALSELPIKIPTVDEQKYISIVLGSLDAKIKANKKINRTLEQMSQTLFKSWFMDFDPVIDNALDAGNSIPEALQSRAELRQKVRNSADFKPLPADIRTLFPAEFEETELGWVPRDWYYVPLKNLGKIICGKTPDKSNKEYYGKDYLFIKIPDMHGKVFVTNSTDKLSTLGSETQIKKLIPKGSICVSCIATVGIVAINSKDCHTNQQINSIVPNSSILRNYLYFSMLEKNKTFHDLASGGSATLNMNTGIFSNVLTLKPEDSVLERFQQTSEHWFGRILANENEIHTLTALRDTLLPKLISGELSLEDLPDLVTQTEPA